MSWVVSAFNALLILLCASHFSVGGASAEELIDPTPEEYADIQTWIPKNCCWTNNCCKKVHESAIISLPENKVRVASTGQVLPRTGWSKDKNTWRCTCNYNADTMQWIVSAGANTRCVFDHPNGY